MRFDLFEQIAVWEMHVPEIDPEIGGFRWTGPADETTLEFPVLRDRALEIRVDVGVVLVPGGLAGLRLSINGQPADVDVSEQAEKGWRLTAIARPAAEPDGLPYVQLVVSGILMARPSDVGASEDRRRLGAALRRWVEIRPLESGRE
jgi:hypothetical protein